MPDPQHLLPLLLLALPPGGLAGTPSFQISGSTSDYLDYPDFSAESSEEFKPEEYKLHLYDYGHKDGDHPDLSIMENCTALHLPTPGTRGT